MTIELKLSEKHHITSILGENQVKITQKFGFNHELFNLTFLSSYFTEILYRIYAFDNKEHLC